VPSTTAAEPNDPANASRVMRSAVRRSSALVAFRPDVVGDLCPAFRA
jgi:hypothetical protein